MKKRFGQLSYWPLFFLLLTSHIALSQDIGAYQGYERITNAVDVKGEKGTLRIEQPFRGVFRFSTFAINTNPVGLSQGIAGANFLVEDSNLWVEEDEEKIMIGDEVNKIEISKDPISIHVFKNDLPIYSELEMLSKRGDTTTLVIQNNLTDEIQGSGARPFDLNFQGKVMNMRNTYQGNYYENATGFEQSINTPLLFNSHKYALLFDSVLPGRVRFDVGGFDSTKIVFRSIGEGDWSYFLILGADNDEILSNYTLLTGRQPMPPRWALGILQSKQSHRNTQEVTNVISTYERVQFPLDAIFLDSEWQEELGDFQFNSTSFPNVESLVSNNFSQGIRTVVRLDPLISLGSSSFGLARSSDILGYDPTANRIGLFPVTGSDTLHALLDIFKPEAKSYLKQKLEILERQGIGGWWSENNEPNFAPNSLLVNGSALEENRNWFSHEWLKTIDESTTAHARPFHLSRSAYVGSQRYGVIPRSGDVVRYWAGLKVQIPIMLHSGMSGFAYMHSDIGGFATDPAKNERDDELDLRWLQMSVFSPIVRFHGRRNTTDLGRIANPFLDAARDAMKLRYKLMPYIYTLAYQNSQTGRPLCLPSNYFENDERLKNRNDQYYFGENLFVAPVLLHGMPVRRVDLPSGTWFNFFNSEAHEGGQAIFQELEVQTIPVYAKAGAIIPMAQNDILHLSDYQIDSLEVAFFQDPSVSVSTFEMYHDDGLSDPAVGTKILFEGASNQNSVSLSTRIDKGDSGIQHILFRMKNVLSIPKNIQVDGKERRVVLIKEQSNPTNAFYDIIKKELHVGVDVEGQEIALSFERNSNEILLSSESNMDFSLKVSPNPTTEEVQLSFAAEEIGRYTIRAVDAKGAISESQYLKVDNKGIKHVEMSLGACEAGVLTIQLLSPSQQMTTQKIVKL